MTADTIPRQGSGALPRVVVGRILQAVPSLILVSMIVFSLLAAAPGDPLTSRMDRDAIVRMTADERAQARSDLGLDQPLPVQYVKWVGRAVSGDLGYSISSGRPAVDEVRERLGPTLLLLGGALSVAVSAGLFAGVTAARRPGSVVDRLLTGTVVMLIATPPFIVGLAMIFVLSVQLGWFPSGGMGVAGEPSTPAMVARHLVLPALVLGLANAAPLARYTRSTMIEVLASDYVRTGRSTGASESEVVRRHGYRNASLPVITIIAVLIPDLLAAAVVTEQVFAWPGLGSLVIRSAQASDAPVLMVIVLIVAVTTIIVNLVADLLYAVADPRVRIS